MSGRKKTILAIIVLLLFTGLFILFIRKNALKIPISNFFKAQTVAKVVKTNSDLYSDTKLKVYDLDKEPIPDPQNPNTSEDLPWVHAKNALTYEITTNKILFERDSKKRVPIASLTKIMTAVIALEHKDLGEKFIVSEKAATIGENAMGISSGEIYTLNDLLYGLILRSGNDAAVAIAEGVSESEESFVEWMNIKAKELGLSDTYFSDASGLNDNTYSTVYDLIKLTRYALKNPDFKRVVGTIDHEIPAVGGEHKYLALSNQTNLLRTYPGVKGVKTGFTEAAQLCLVTYAENDGYEIIGVVLASDARKTDMIQLLDYSFEKLGVKISHPLLDF